jgi:tripartite-type tricarboxylate transporter receptor subunit TctC
MDGDGWVGVLVPAGTPKEIGALLNKQINETLALPDLKEKFSAAGLDVIGGSPEDFAGIMRTEGERWAKVIKAANIKAK